MAKIHILGAESLGVRGLSCCVENDDHKILIDPGVALGYTRWGLHPHPLQAVVGYIVCSKIARFWRDADYVVFTHMHGDHIPLYNANPFQLDLYMLDHHGEKKIIAPSPHILSTKEKIRLEKIREIYREKLIMIGWRAAEIGPVKVYGPYPHGLSRSGVYAVYIDSDLPVLHLSDTGLLVEDVIRLVRDLRPDIVVTDGPPIYRYMHNKVMANDLLVKARQNLERMIGYADKVIVDHHINRCDEGYQWINSVRREYSCIMTGAEYMGEKPLMLESWRRTLYRLLPEDNYWFRENYRETIEKYRVILRELITRIRNDTKQSNEASFSLLLSKILAKK